MDNILRREVIPQHEESEVAVWQVVTRTAKFIL